MAIVTEFYLTREDGVTLNRAYSDAGYMIRQDATGAEYSEAIDPADAGQTYTETDTPISTPEPEYDELADAQAALAELGVTPEEG